MEAWHMLDYPEERVPCLLRALVEHLLEKKWNWWKTIRVLKGEAEARS